MVGTGLSAQLGILIKSANAFENGFKLSKLVFDKTGTLTTGKMAVVDIQTQLHIDDFLCLVYCAEDASEHHIAQSITLHIKSKIPQRTLNQYRSINFEAEPGRGISCTLKQNNETWNVMIGNLTQMHNSKIEMPLTIESTKQDHESKGHTVVFVAINNQYAGLIAVSDIIKKDAKEAIQSLHKLGIKVAMVSGDQYLTCKYIAHQLGITEVHAGITPAGKKSLVKEMQNVDVVGMCGDGVNDAAALVQSDFGIAVFGGTGVAIEAADIVLMRDSLEDVLKAVYLCRAIYQRIRMNFMWATL